MSDELERQYNDMKEIIDALLVRAETAEADNAKLRELVAKLIEVSDVLAEYTDENVYVWESAISKAVEDWRALGIEWKEQTRKVRDE